MTSRVYDSALVDGDFGKGWQLSLTAANELVITRNAANRVTSITDKHGRQVNYSYGKQGLLETATDLGGQVWHYRYFGNGLLKQVIDPENHIAASFKYDNRGRVRFAQVRAVETSYQYSDGQTVVFEDKNQTVFHFNSEGITTSVTNAEGFTSSVKLDENHQVVELSHNNQRTAVFTYLPDGRTESITQGDKVNFLQYNAQNQFTGLLQDGESVMGIKRDDEGRPLSISGDGLKKEYTYYPNGDVRTFKSGDIDRTFQYYPSGLLKQLVENGKTASFEYNPLGRLQKITFPTGEVHEYQYDERGFRKSTTKNNGSKLHYNYDKTGNYRGNTATDAKGEKTIKEIVVDQHNQVKQQLIDGRLAMDVQYQRGNPKSLTHGEHTIEYDFDKLNRLHKISNGLAEPIDYAYASDEEDLRIQQDDRTVGVYLDKKETSLAATLYTRTAQTPWPHIIWNEALGQLQLASKTGIIPPDTVFRSAAKRRRLYDAVMRNKQSSKDFNKPSSSFWTPPEYLATNCDPTECMIYGVFFDPIGPIYLGQPIEISALAESDLSCDPNYTFYVDGRIVYSSSSFSSVPYTFNTAGNHEIKVLSRCKCAESNVWGVWAFEQVTVLPLLTQVAIATPTKIWTIDQQRNMPAVRFQANYAPLSVALSDITFHWYLTLDFTEHGKNYRHRVPAAGTVNIKGSTFWTPDWAGQLAGGNNMTVHVSASAGTNTMTANPVAGYQIHGENPTQAQIFTVATSDEAKAVAWQESSHRQFSGQAYTGSGLPLYGAPDGWGLMQRDPLQSEAQLWNWHTALRDGVDYLNRVHGDAQRYLNTWYSDLQDDNDPTNDWSWDPRSESPERVWREAFSRYNTGLSSYSPNGNFGDRNCNENDRYGNLTGCNYADRIQSHIDVTPWSTELLIEELAK